MKTDNKLIVSLQKKFKLFKAPNRIGDILDYEGIEYLIIGIEKVTLRYSALYVTYTCQNLRILHSEQPNVINNANTLEFYADVNISDYVEDRGYVGERNLISIGKVFEHKGYYYRWITYSDLEFDFTTLRVSTFAQPIRPMSVTSARKQLLEHKKQKIGLSLL